MRPLAKALEDHELIVLRVIGEWWELDLTGSDKATSISKLAELLPQIDIPQELISLPPDEAEAIRTLVRLEGRMPVAAFKRQYGDVRSMGPGALERDEPWFDPQSSAEDLWYRGLLYRGFDQTDDGLVEFFYLPTEFFEQFEQADFQQPRENTTAHSFDDSSIEDEDDYEAYEEVEGPALVKEKRKLDLKTPKWAEALLADNSLTSDAQPETEKPKKTKKETKAEAKPKKKGKAKPKKSVKTDEEPVLTSVAATSPPIPRRGTEIEDDAPVVAADAGLVDDFTTLLTLAQAGRLPDGEGAQAAPLSPYLLNTDPIRISWMLALGRALNLLRQVTPLYRPTRGVVEWLQKPREAQIRSLADAWLGSTWNDLRRVPTLRCEGSGWENDPKLARHALLDSMARQTEWTSSDAVIQRVKEENPDFQRPNGNYDTWYIRDLISNRYVTGFENWEMVEGRLLHYLIEKPLHWLGMVDLAGPQFRLTPRGIGWIESEPIEETIPDALLRLHEDGIIEVPFETDRYKRFKVGRIAALLPLEHATSGDHFAYRITPSSLNQARQDNIGPQRVLDFLKAEYTGPLPSGLARSIERWSQNGPEGFVESVIILRVKERAILDTLRQHPKTRHFIADSLSDTVAVVMTGRWSELCSAAASLGLLLEPPASDQ